MALDVRWKLADSTRALDSGTGTTIDLSSGGILFDADRNVSVGRSIRLSIAWPVLLDQTLLQVLFSGKVVRVEGRRIAVHTNTHEFRTVARARAQAAGRG